MAHLAKIIGSAPVLLVADVVKSANYFRDQLGFIYDRFWSEPPDFCMVKRDGFIVMLSQAPAGTSLMPDWQATEKVWNAYFWCDDAERLHAEFASRGARIDYSPRVQEYGIKEFGVRDIDGHNLAFGQHV
jgi:predicted lactoylglutathione lyase